MKPSNAERLIFGCGWFAFIALALLLIATEARAAIATYSHETIDGLVKICYYRYYGGTVTTNVRSYEVCPMTIEVDD